MGTKNLDDLYSLRTNFIVIGLTGRKGTRCDDITKILEKDRFEDNFFLPPDEFVSKTANRIDHPHNTKETIEEDLKTTQKKTINDEMPNYPGEIDKKKYKIIYDYMKKNWEGFHVIKYKHVLLLYILRNNLNEFKKFIEKINVEDEFIKKYKSVRLTTSEINNLIHNLKVMKYNLVSSKVKEVFFDISINKYKSTHKLFFKNKAFKTFSDEFDNLFETTSPVFRMLLLQNLSNIIRKKGDYKEAKSKTAKTSGNDIHVYDLVEIIKVIIKSISDEYKRKNPSKKYKKVHVVIDSLRNSLEIMFLKERYSGFYMFAVSNNEKCIDEDLRSRFKKFKNKVKLIDDIEYKGETENFFKQDVIDCIQISDVHINNSKENEYTTFESDLKIQVLKFLALIMQPGIITPSPRERCMQIAFTAKHNSGCISRQVGAVISDKYYSIKSIGWNNTSEGHVPCILRDVTYLCNSEKKDDCTFSEYERSNPKFLKEIRSNYKILDKKYLNGRNISFCFKEIKNIIDKHKNQVHTRSLHAEENAFLQISKYGGQSINGGYLFTTSSPCELCSKKAYQMGIKKIFYIEKYEGISKDHILSGIDEKKDPKLIPFAGAVGQGYFKFYEPFLSYKDELALILGLNIKEKLKSMKN